MLIPWACLFHGLCAWLGAGMGQCPLEGTVAPPWAVTVVLGAAELHLLESRAALEGDRDPRGAACLQGYHLCIHSALTLPPSLTPTYSHGYTQTHMFTVTHILNAHIIHPCYTCS